MRNRFPGYSTQKKASTQKKESSRGSDRNDDRKPGSERGRGGRGRGRGSQSKK
jgi:hypothetical protein